MVVTNGANGTSERWFAKSRFLMEFEKAGARWSRYDRRTYHRQSLRRENLDPVRSSRLSVAMEGSSYVERHRFAMYCSQQTVRLKTIKDNIYFAFILGPCY